MVIQLLLLFLSLIFLPACGKKGPPVPPEAARPEPPRKLQLRLHPLFAEISFKIPLEDIRGEALKDLKAFRIEKRQVPAGRSAPVMIRHLDLPFKGNLSETERFSYRDRHLRAGFCYTYRIAAIKGFRSVSDWSSSISFCWTTPPRSPEELEARRLLPKGVFLSWKPVTRDIRGSPLRRVLYVVHRRSPEGSRKFPLITDTAFYDAEALPQKTYCYAVEPFIPYYGTLVPGFRSPEVCLKP